MPMRGPWRWEGTGVPVNFGGALEAAVRPSASWRWIHRASAGVSAPFLLRRVSTVHPVSAEGIPVATGVNFSCSVTVSRHLRVQRMKPGEMLANLFRQFLSGHARHKFLPPGTGGSAVAFPYRPKEPESRHAAGTTGSRSKCRAENFTFVR